MFSSKLSRLDITTNILPALVKKSVTERKEIERDEVRAGDRRSGEWAGQRRYC